MWKKILDYVEQHHMIEPGDRLVAGISGGADSVCLLLVLLELQKKIGFTLQAVHVEHGIRGEESLADAAFTKRLCDSLGVACEIRQVDVPGRAQASGLGLEEAARELRYQCFRQICEESGANKVAVAHHGNDVAETMLFHLSRGTGIRGLGSIAPVTDRDGYELIRPLLGVTRAEIEDWLQQQGQTYCVDQTNQDPGYARNRIRLQVIPELEQVNAQAVSHLQKTAAHLQEISAYLDETSWELGSAGMETFGEEGWKLNDGHLKAMPPVLRRNFLYQMLGCAAGNRKDFTALHVELLEGLLHGEVGKRLCFPHGVLVKKTYDSILLTLEGDPKQKGEMDEVREKLAVPLLIEGETRWDSQWSFQTEILDFDGNTQKIPGKTYTKWFDYDKIKFTVQLRTRAAGDYIQTDSRGGHKKMKKYFVDEKIPQEQRDDILLLADGQHILWVVGHRISEGYKVTEQTKRILCVRVLPNTTIKEDL